MADLYDDARAVETAALRAEIARLQYDLQTKHDNLGAALAEIEWLKETLGCALGEHELEHGRFAGDYLPKHWTHTARRLLGAVDEQSASEVKP